MHYAVPLILMGAASLCISVGCATKIAQAPGNVAVPLNDNSYMDLQPGTSLRILVPILTSGRYQVLTDSARQEGGAMVLSAANLIGYEVSYAVEGRNAGRIRLKFRSAEITKDAKTIQETNAPPLPFAFPAKAYLLALANHAKQLVPAWSSHTLIMGVRGSGLGCEIRRHWLGAFINRLTAANGGLYSFLWQLTSGVSPPLFLA